MRWMLAAVAVMLSGCGMSKGIGLTDPEAARLLDDYLTRRNRILPVGEVRFVRGAPDIKRGEVDLGATAWYEQLAAEGTLTISGRIVLSDNRSFSWDNFYELSQRGVQERLLAQRTQAGTNRHKCAPERLKTFGLSDGFCVNLGTGRVEEIVGSETIQAGAEHYYFFMGNHTWKYSPLALPVINKYNGDTTEQRKFMVLASYDPFLKKWSIDEKDVDFAPRGGTFANRARFDNLLGVRVGRKQEGVPRLW